MVTNFKKKLKGTTTRHQVILHAAGITVSLAFVLLVYANYQMYQKKQEFLAQVSSLQSQADDLQQQNTTLAQGIAGQDNNQYIEKVAREQLDLQKNGETVVSFVAPPATAAQNTKTPVQSIWETFTSWVKNKF